MQVTKGTSYCAQTALGGVISKYHMRVFTFSSFMAQDALTFVDVRFAAYNKNPDNNNNNNNKGAVHASSRDHVPMSPYTAMLTGTLGPGTGADTKENSVLHTGDPATVPPTL